VTNTWEKNLPKGWKVILAHGFRGVSPWSLDSVTSGPVHGEAEYQGGKNVVEQSGLPYGGQRKKQAERQRERTAVEGSRDKIHYLSDEIGCVQVVWP
jgi:hypothetical protein